MGKKKNKQKDVVVMATVDNTDLDSTFFEEVDPLSADPELEDFADEVLKDLPQEESLAEQTENLSEEGSEELPLTEFEKEWVADIPQEIIKDTLPPVKQAQVGVAGKVYKGKNALGVRIFV